MSARRLAVVAAALAALGAPGAARAAGDAAVTATYVRANYALVAAGHANIRRTEAAVKGLVGKIERECPRGALGSPQNSESTALSNELIGLMVLTGGRVDRPAVGAYLRTVSALRWSNPAINRAVTSYLKGLRTLYTLKTPSFCEDIRSWAASAFKKLPVATAPFVARFIPAWVSLGVLPAGLARFESGELRALARRSARYETELMEMEARLVETWGEIMNELELYP